MDGISEDLYELRDHQTKALKKLSNGKILWGGVGTGKSRVAAAYYHKNEAPKNVYIITTAKKRDSFDWQEEFYRLGIGPATGPTQPDVGRARRSVGTLKRSGPDGPSGLLLEGDAGREAGTDASELGGVAGIYPWVLTIDSWNNIAKYADVAGAFFIFDEQRLVGSGDWTRKFLRIAKHNNWILLSGTPGDTWMDYIPVFVANDFYKNRTAFKREHVVYNTFTKFPKVDRYINIGKLMRQRADLLVEMPYERHTKRRIVEVPLRFDKEALEMVLKKRWHIYEDRPLRDVAEMFSVARKVVNSDRSRIEMVEELWQKHPKLIVFYNFNYELEILRGLASRATSTPETSRSSTTGNGSETGWEESGNSSSTSIPTSIDGSKSSGRFTGSLEGDRSSSAGAYTGRSDPRWTRTTRRSANSFDDGLSSISTPVFSTSSTAPVTSIATIESSPTTSHTNTISLIATSGETERERSPGFGTIPESTTSSLTDTTIAEWNGHKHQPVPSTRKWLYLVQYIAGAEAWECTETDAMVMYSRNYSWKIFEQACGRIDRLNTPFQELWYYDFMSESFIDLAIGRALKAKQTFNEAKYAQLFKE